MPVAQQSLNAYRADVQIYEHGTGQTAARQTTNPCARSLQIVLHAHLEDVARDWLRLQAQPNISLHQSFAWCSAWVQSHKNPVIIVEGRISGTCAFLLPLEIVSSRFGRTARFIGAPFSNINTGLFSRTFEHEADPALLQDIVSRLKTKLRGQADLLVLSNMPAIWRGVHNPFLFLPSLENQNRSFQLPLLETLEETLSQINAKRRRKKYRTSLKRLEALGGYEHITCSDAGKQHELLDLYFRQKAVRFQSLGLPDAFKAAETKAFFHSLLDMPVTDGNIPLHLHALKLASTGQIAAIAGLSRKDDHVICQFSSIDETIAPDASPGEFLFYLMIEACQAQGAGVFDFGIGDQLYKRSWCPVETVQSDIILPLTLVGQTGAVAAKSVLRTKTFIKQNPGLYRLVQRLRSSHSVPASADPEND